MAVPFTSTIVFLFPGLVLDSESWRESIETSRLTEISCEASPWALTDVNQLSYIVLKNYIQVK